MATIKQTIVKLFIKYKQFIMFCCVGVANTLVALIIYKILLELGAAPYFGKIADSFADFSNVSKTGILICSAIGDIAGAINSYLMNRFWVFRHNKVKTKSSILKFAVTFGVYMLASWLLMDFCISTLKIDEFIAKIVVLPITTVLNFFMSKLWTFKKTKNV